MDNSYLSFVIFHLACDDHSSIQPPSTKIMSPVT